MLIILTTSVVGGSCADIITDDMGRKITVKAPFARIISLYAGHTETLFSLELDSEIIGVSPSETYPEKALTKPVFSYHDDLEKFLAARPNLVLIRPMIDRGYVRLLANREKNGITAVSLQLGNLDEIYRYWLTLSALTGKEAESGRLVAGFKHSLAIFAIETAGGINLAKDAEPVRDTNIAAYGKERILSHAAEMDVFMAPSGPMNHITVETIQNEPGFSMIKAVQTRQIYLINEVLVSRPTVKLLEGIRTIVKILYPDLTLRAQASVFLQTPDPSKGVSD